MDERRQIALRGAVRSLKRSARAVAVLFWIAGVSLFLDSVRPLLPDAPEQMTWGERRVAGIVAVVTLGGFGLAGLVASGLLRAVAELIETVADGTEAAVRTSHLVETQVVPGLARLALAIEGVEGGAVVGTARAVSAVRRAVREGRFRRAGQLIEAIRRDNPRAPEIAELSGELSRARQAEADDLRARLDAAIASEDLRGVIACRDALTQHLQGEPLCDLDRRVVGWLSDRIGRQVRSGKVTPDLAVIAGRVADSFGDSPEGSALLSALPDLRRRAGLCPGCARPYRGRSDACPDCLAERAGHPA